MPLRVTALADLRAAPLEAGIHHKYQIQSCRDLEGRFSRHLTMPDRRLLTTNLPSPFRLHNPPPLPAYAPQQTMLNPKP